MIYKLKFCHIPFKVDFSDIEYVPASCYIVKMVDFLLQKVHCVWMLISLYTYQESHLVYVQKWRTWIVSSLYSRLWVSISTYTYKVSIFSKCTCVLDVFMTLYKVCVSGQWWAVSLFRSEQFLFAMMTGFSLQLYVVSLWDDV